MKQLGKLKAFTLAEVLITLGIIGVVAAISIPVLMKNTQNAELKTAFKKSYANLMQAYNSVTYDNGGTPYKCYFDAQVWNWVQGECSTFWDEMKTKLKVSKTYNGPVDGINLPNYTATDASNFNGTGNLSCSANVIASKVSKEAWIFNDGSIIMSYGSVNIRDFVGVILDTNGMRGPNKWGYDLFLVQFSNHSTDGYKMNLDDWICRTVEQGGYRTDDIILNN